MTDGPLERTQKIGSLDVRRIHGVNANVLINQLQPFLDEMRGVYNQQLIVNTKRDNRPHEMTVYLLVALSDLETMLKEVIRRGAKAAGKLEKMKDDA